MQFGTLMNKLFSVKEMFPEMRWAPVAMTYGESTLTITIPISEENAQLLIDAQRMFEPRDDRHDW